MDGSLLTFGLAKALFGIFVGAVGIFVASRVLHRLLGSGEIDAHTKAGNTAIGVLKAGSLVALGILFQHPVSATFSAFDLLYRDRSLTMIGLRRVMTYALLHLSLSIVVGAVVLALGTWLFTRLTRGVDEIDEIRKGNVAPAIVLAAVMVVLALMTAPGLENALEGLLPLPQLGRDQIYAPS
jgi:uncharacterized membrane protein YjfL (UPF0719 family)